MHVPNLSTFIPIGIIVVGLVVGLAVRWALDLFLAHRYKANHITTQLLAVVLRRARPYVVIWALLGATAISVTFLSLTSLPQLWIQRLIAALGYATVTLFVASTSLRLLRGLGERSESFRPIEGMAERITQVVFAVVGLLLVLNALAIPITPLLTTLGVAGLATALALQDTLSNFFAGFYLLADRPIRSGDLIRLDTGDQGYVIEVGWRTTRIRTLQNNVVVLPNQKLSQSIITNFSLPEPRTPVVITVGVDYSSDPDQVQAVLEEIGREAIGDIPGLLADPPPVARLSPGFGQSSLDFSLVCQVAQFTDQFFAQHELRKRILKRFRAEGISIPFNTQTLQLDPTTLAALLHQTSPPSTTNHLPPS